YNKIMEHETEHVVGVDDSVHPTPEETPNAITENATPQPVPEVTPPKFTDMYKKTFGFGKLRNKKENNKYKEAEEVSEDTLKDLENISVFTVSDEEEIPNYKYSGTLFSTYIMIEMGDDVYIVDQHAAHERIMYEKVKMNFYDDEEKDSQIMLLPDIITLTHKEKDIVKENAELFVQAGFTFEEFGESTIRLIGVPTIVLDLDTEELFKEMLDEINTVALTALKEKEEKLISTMACKAAVKAKTELKKEEVESLMDKLLKLENPFTCPHGRPTAIRMSKTDIEKKFGRR
ncbi:MAG: hypothetical protein FWC68_04050, partial [Oscillospiraceae bacterium]|nr:hypothetical protein [Oscillospiraceae bacterium]